MASNFTQTPNQTRTIGLSFEQVGLLEEIIAYTKMDGSGVFYESKTALARKFNTSRPRVIRLINSLIKQNIIYQSPTKNKHDTLNITLRPIEDWIPIPIKADVTKCDIKTAVTKRYSNCNKTLHQPSQNVTVDVTNCDINNIRNNINNNKSKNSMGDAHACLLSEGSFEEQIVTAKLPLPDANPIICERVDEPTPPPPKALQRPPNELISEAMDSLYNGVDKNLEEDQLTEVAVLFINKQNKSWNDFKKEWYAKLKLKNCKAIWAKEIWGWVKAEGAGVLKPKPKVVHQPIPMFKFNPEPWEWNLKQAK